jgi:hypothetical protein
MLLNVKQVRMWKEDIKNYLKVLYQHLADRLSGYLVPEYILNACSEHYLCSGPNIFVEQLALLLHIQEERDWLS